MSECSGGRTSIHIRCSPAFKLRVQEWAKRQNKIVSDAVIDELKEALKFEEVYRDGKAVQAADDWQSMVMLTSEGKNL
jgi:hypothetical protein